jgi:ectoine hydroxylase-related dioxygenase (phytanoyl-CoA dioxygenase family)
MSTQDLSLQHGMVGALMGPAAVEPRHELSAAQLRQFDEQGFVAGVRILDDRQVDALLAELDGWMRPEHAGRELWYEYRANASADPARAMLHASGAWRIGRGFHDLLWSPAVVGPARQLLGGGVRFMQDQLFCKPPSRGGVVAWHQDYSYWTFAQPMGHVTCWIALDDVSMENGSLCYIPGSHRWGLLPITGLTGEMGAIEGVLSARQRAAFRPVALELKRGEASFHHPLLVHGSHDNTSARPRRATVLNLMRDGTRAAAAEPETDGLPAFMLRPTEETVFYEVGGTPRGRVLDGRYFPLLGA